jgi:hypothetical protein
VDLIKLNTNNQAGPLVENFDSLIWTERYNTTGNFQLTTGNIDVFMATLPKQSRISLRESNVPMIVETHDIERKKNAGAKLTITGRSFESILDRRVSINSVIAALSEWAVVAKIPSDVAHYIINQICVVGVNDAADIFPSSVVQFITPADYLITSGPNRQFVVPRSNLLATVLGLIQTRSEEDTSTTPDTPAIQPHGIRSIRPNTVGTAIGIEIYQGVDRSDEILFDATRDMLNDGRYLFSDVGSANTAYVLGPTISAKMNQGASVPTGLDRRVILVDGTSSGVESEEALRAEGSRAMSDAHITARFDGSINEDLSPYIYGVDYFLGDIVSLQGDYGLEEKARVTEYIRSYGPDGYKAFPTLTAIEGEES